MTSTVSTELYRVKFRIAPPDTGHGHSANPLGVQAWVVGAPDPEYLKGDAESSISNRTGDLAKAIDDTLRTDPGGMDKHKPLKETKKKSLDALMEKSDAKALAAAAPSVHQDVSGARLAGPSADDAPAAEKANTIAAPRESGAAHGQADLRLLAGKDGSGASETLPDATGTAHGKQAQSPLLKRATNKATAKGLSNAASSHAHAAHTPFSTESIAIQLSLPPNEETLAFQAILHVHLIPDADACRLVTSTTSLDRYTGSVKADVLRVDYYRHARQTLGAGNILSDHKAHAEQRATLAATLLDETRFQADDLATISRVYFLTQISAARHAFLADLGVAARLIERLNPDAGKRHQDTLVVWPEEEPVRDDVPAACGEVWRLASKEQPDKYHAQPLWYERVDGWIAGKAKKLHRTIQKNSDSVALKLAFYAVCALGAVCIGLQIWAPYMGQPGASTSSRVFWSVVGAIWPACLVVVAAVFLFYALNLRPLQERAQEMLVEWRTHRFADLVASLGSANANVATSRVGIRWIWQGTPDGATRQEGVELLVPPVPETVLSRLDEQLHVKERLTSLERVLKAHDTQTAEKMHHIEESQAKVRRAITAGASGVFVGLVTSEVGEMVFRYLHVVGESDQNALLFWLTEQRNAIADAPVHTGTEAGAHGHSPREDYAHKFHHHELFAHSLLLTITLVFSLIAAAIAIRKPANEQGGGHGHH